MGFLEITLAFFSRAKSKQSPGSGSGEKLSAHSLRISKKAPGSQVLFGFQRFRRFCKRHHSKLRILCKMPHGRRSRSTSGSCAGTERRAHSGAYRKKRSHVEKGLCTWPYIYIQFFMRNPIFSSEMSNSSVQRSKIRKNYLRQTYKNLISSYIVLFFPRRFPRKFLGNSRNFQKFSRNFQKILENFLSFFTTKNMQLVHPPV